MALETAGWEVGISQDVSEVVGVRSGPTLGTP